MLTVYGPRQRIWYLSPMRAAKVQASLRIREVSSEPSLLAHTSSESRGTFRQKARSLAPLNGWACAVKICHDGMLEYTNSLDGAHIVLELAIALENHLIAALQLTVFQLILLVTSTHCFSPQLWNWMEKNLMLHSFICHVLRSSSIDVTFTLFKIRLWAGATGTVKKNINEPEQNKANKITCAPSEDSEQPGYPPSLIRASLCDLRTAKDLTLLHANSEDSDQSGRIPRLIWVYAGRTCHFDGFIVLRLKYHCLSLRILFRSQTIPY